MIEQQTPGLLLGWLLYASPGVFFLYHAFKQTSLIRCEQF
jgi:hypothetical protein